MSELKIFKQNEDWPIQSQI